VGVTVTVTVGFGVSVNVGEIGNAFGVAFSGGTSIRNGVEFLAGSLSARISNVPLLSILIVE
jgi:hypothetical protein